MLQKMESLKPTKNTFFTFPLGFFYLKKQIPKKFREGGAKSKGNIKRYKGGGDRIRMGTHKRKQHTPPTHSPPGDEGCYCSAAGSMYKHPLPVPLPDHATQRTKSATKLQLIQMANSNNNSDNILMRRTPTPIKTHHPPSTGPAPDHRPRWRRCLRHSSSLCHYQRYHRR